MDNQNIIIKLFVKRATGTSTIHRFRGSFNSFDDLRSTIAGLVVGDSNNGGADGGSVALPGRGGQQQQKELVMKEKEQPSNASSSSAQRSIVLEYQDEDGDNICITCDMEWDECLEQYSDQHDGATARPPLRLFVTEVVVGGTSTNNNVKGDGRASAEKAQAAAAAAASGGAAAAYSSDDSSNDGDESTTKEYVRVEHNNKRSVAAKLLGDDTTAKAPAAAAAAVAEPSTTDVRAAAAKNTQTAEAEQEHAPAHHSDGCEHDDDDEDEVYEEDFEYEYDEDEFDDDDDGAFATGGGGARGYYTVVTRLNPPASSSSGGASTELAKALAVAGLIYECDVAAELEKERMDVAFGSVIVRTIDPQPKGDDNDDSTSKKKKRTAQVEISKGNLLNKALTHANGLLNTRRIEVAEALLLKLGALFPRNALVDYNLACAAAMVGNVERSIFNLETAVANGYTNGATVMNDPELAVVRTDARVQAIIAQLGAGSVTKQNKKTMMKGFAAQQQKQAPVDHQVQQQRHQDPTVSTTPAATAAAAAAVPAQETANSGGNFGGFIGINDNARTIVAMFPHLTKKRAKELLHEHKNDMDAVANLLLVAGDAQQ